MLMTKQHQQRGRAPRQGCCGRKSKHRRLTRIAIASPLTPAAAASLRARPTPAAATSLRARCGSNAANNPPLAAMMPLALASALSAGTQSAWARTQGAAQLRRFNAAQPAPKMSFDTGWQSREGTASLGTPHTGVDAATRGAQQPCSPADGMAAPAGRATAGGGEGGGTIPISAGMDRARSILNDGPRVGAWVTPGGAAGAAQPNFAAIADNAPAAAAAIYDLPRAWAERVGFVPGLHAAVDSIRTRRASGLSAHRQGNTLEQQLGGKAIMLIGDSTDSNVWSEMTGCKHDNAHGDPKVVGPLLPIAEQAVSCALRRKLEQTAQFDSSCFSDRGLNLTLHYVGGEHIIHPYDLRYPGLNRGTSPECAETEPLVSCLRRKFAVNVNDLGSFDAARPDLVVVQCNVWLWHAGQVGDRHWLHDPWNLTLDSYKQNLTRVVALVRQLLGPQLIALKTTAGISDTARQGLTVERVSRVNAAVRSLGAELDLPVVDCEVMLPRHLAKTGAGLFDDIHPLVAFNRALGSIYLNALAALSRRPTHPPTTAPNHERGTRA